MKKKARRLLRRILSRETVEFAGYGVLVFGVYLVNEVGAVFAAGGVLLLYGYRGGD